MESGATFSEDRIYRYKLWKIWDSDLKTIMFIGLNPSTADEQKDDPTIRRLTSYAHIWGYGGINVVNLFCLCSSDPKLLYEVDDPIGIENDGIIRSVAEQSDRVVGAWGNHGKHMNRGNHVIQLLDSNLYCFGLTKQGQPKHPLYLSRNAQLLKVNDVR